MNCEKCGAQVNEGQSFCTNCGNILMSKSSPKSFSQSGYGTNGDAQTNYNFGQQGYNQPNSNYGQQDYNQSSYNYGQQDYSQPYNYGQPNMTSQNQPMKWYKFLIYFALFAGAVINLFSGISALSGSQYGESADLVYAYIDGLKTVDVIYGLACIAVAAFGVYVRFRLAEFRADGPQMLNYLYIASAAVALIYVVIAGIIISKYSGSFDTELITDILPTLIVSAVMVVLNTQYFNKRKHMFNR